MYLRDIDRRNMIGQTIEDAAAIYSINQQRRNLTQRGIDVNAPECVITADLFTVYAVKRHLRYLLKVGALRLDDGVIVEVNQCS